MNRPQIKILPWTITVYILSFSCYLPMLLKQLGMNVPESIVSLKYLFILTPAILALLTLLWERDLKTFLHKLFCLRGKAKDFYVCFAFLAVGLSVSCCYQLQKGVNLFENAYPSFAALLAGCIYLFLTGFMEEIAWRGFLLERVPANQKKLGAIMLAGILWAFWHIPMWTIRNSLSLTEISPLFLWAVLTSLVLGHIYIKCKNIFVVSVLHMIFNTCFLAPVAYNIVVLVVIVMIAWSINRSHQHF